MTDPSASPWARPNDQLGRAVTREADNTLRSYGEQPNLITEHANHEKDTARGGYADRQIFELVQNGADALASVPSGGRVAVLLSQSHLYCADNGEPIDHEGVIALTFSHMSPKRGSREIGRFGLGFKSVLGVSQAPEFFSRTGSFRFDPEVARRRIRDVAPRADTFPTLRLPEPIDPQECRNGDPMLAELMEWANNIVRLPLIDEALHRLQKQIRVFPGQFLLFVEHLQSLSLRDRPGDLTRRFSVKRSEEVRVLSDGHGTTRWRLFARSHELTNHARSDSRTLDDAHKCTIRWAAPLERSSDPGHFWAFFPTRTASLVSGILNAPWKTNEDRQNLLAGPYNDELIEAAASLVADSLPELATGKDPARHLDALPRRAEPGDTDHSSRLRARLFFKFAQKRRVVPGQNGELHAVRGLLYPPRVLTSGGSRCREALDEWAAYSGRPKKWAHNRAVTRDRLAKIVRLSECLPETRGTSRDLPQASIAKWLEALVRNQPGHELVRASMAAVRTAARIPSAVRPGSHEGIGRIVLLANGRVHAPDPASIFLPDPEAASDESPPSHSEIHPELAQDVDTHAALQELGITMASPESRFREVVSIALDRYGAALETTWVWFWYQSRQLSPKQALGIIRASRVEPRVRTVKGGWAPSHSVLLPGSIVDGSGEDAEATVDAKWHADDMELVRSLGVVSEPRDMDLSAEPWFRGFQEDRRKEFQALGRQAVGTTPQGRLIGFDSTVGGGPLHVFGRLSPLAAARYTQSLLSLKSNYRPWVMRHESQTHYRPMEFDSPALDILREHGWVDTHQGPVPLCDALGTRPTSTAGLYELLNHPKVDWIKNAFELTEPDPVFTGEMDPVPLVDRWPGLRHHLRDDQQGIYLRLCDDIAVAGRERRCVLHGGDIYMAIAVDEESDQLGLIAVRLALRLNADQLERIRRRRTEQQVEARRATVRQAATNPERLLRAVGESELRAGLGDATLTILEEGEQLTGIQVAEAVIATHHTDSLRQFKWALEPLDPPKQWAGSTAALKFVRSLGFPREWAGQRGRRRDSYQEVHGPFRLPPLHGYQEKIAENVRSLLRDDDHTERRGLIALPTGSGKTRVAVQSLVAAMCEDGFSGTVLWVADRDELCEQAVKAWAQVWSAIGRPETLRVTRLWGNQPDPERLDAPHVIVATIQTLAARLQRRDGWDDFLADIRVVIFDEAHRTVAPTFTTVMDELGLTRWEGSPDVRLIGLTATPYRGYNEAETAWLVQRYGNNRLDRGAFRSDDQGEVVRELQENAILARVDHETIEGGDFDPNERELAWMADAPWLPKRAETMLTRDVDRTRRILRACQHHVREDWPALVFATSVEHAGILAALLSAKGIRARAVSGKTEIATRRRIVDEFRNGDIQALVNYAVFREGFDAPRTRLIVVARPVFSPNLYFQMIGRAMRGPKNGGNDRCLVLNVKDNIQQFDRALAFTELDWLWARGSV